MAQTLGLCLLSLLAVPATRLPVEAANAPRVVDKAVLLKSDSHELRISLQCPRFIFDAGAAGGASPTRIKGGLSRGEPLEVSYPAQAIGTNGQLEVRLLLQWSARRGRAAQMGGVSLEGTRPRRSCSKR